MVPVNLPRRLRGSLRAGPLVAGVPAAPTLRRYAVPGAPVPRGTPYPAHRPPPYGTS
jgi:hypothetical protein